MTDNATKKTLAESLSTSLAFLRNEVVALQEELLQIVDERINEMSVPLFQKIVDRLLTLEQDKNRLTEDFQANALRVFEEHVHQTILQEFNITLPEDVVRKPLVDSLNEQLNQLHTNLQEQIDAVRGYEHPDLARVEHMHDGVYAPFNHTHLDIWADLTKLHQQLTSDQQHGLERHYSLQTHFETLQADVQTKLLDFLTKFQAEKTANIQRISDYNAEIAKKLSDVVETVVMRIEKSETTFGRELASLRTEVTEQSVDFHTVIDTIKSYMYESLNTKSDIGHTHTEFSTFAPKNHTHKEFGLLDKKIDRVEENALNKKDFERLIKEAVGRLPIPKDGTHGKSWQFRFDVNRRGLLLYKREDEVEWKQEWLMGPKGDPGSSEGGGNEGGGGGGSGGATFDAYVNGSFLARGIYQVDFVGDNVAVTNPFTGRIEVAYAGGGGSGTGVQLFIQPTPPVVMAGTKYQWIQTNPTDGSIVTVWYDDGVH